MRRAEALRRIAVRAFYRWLWRALRQKAKMIRHLRWTR